MPFSPYNKLTGSLAQYPRGTYGIEVEAERFSTAELTRLMEGIPSSIEKLAALRPYWSATTDGSLRHNGVEWISKPLNMILSEQALNLLYDAMDDGLFQSSVRAGIHVHANMAPVTNVEFVQALRSYAVLEPLLFRYVGVAREQNIYCVPLYRAVNEQRLWVRIAGLLSGNAFRTRADHQMCYALIRECCKYSALNISTFIRLGTFEFRHAPTFDRRDEALNWLRLVHEVSMFQLPADAGEDSLIHAKPWAMALIPKLDWDDYVAEVRGRGLLGYANKLQPFTYKAPEWGKPAGMAFDRNPMPPALARPTRRPAHSIADQMLAEMQESVARNELEELLGRRPPQEQVIFVDGQDEPNEEEF
jgi:hypothetical protein